MVQRDNLRLKDELIQARVDSYAIRQQSDELKAQLEATKEQLTFLTQENSELKDRIAAAN
jgi:predicted nuclease with TOPRIM domain